MVRRGLNCYPGHGASSPYSAPLSHVLRGATLDRCKEECHSTPGCSGVITSSEAGDALEARFSCFFRSNIDPASCLRNNRFDLHLAPRLPNELWDALDEYSTQLYGVPGVLNQVPFNILWPSLLPQAVLQHISPRCSAPSHYDDAVVPYTFLPFNFLMHAGLWVHRPSNEVSGPFADNEWAEVTHCGYQLETVTEHSPMWFLGVAGSGVHINVGKSFRTAVLREPEKGCQEPFGICDSTPNQNAHLAHGYLVGGQIELTARLLGIDNIEMYDSIQFPHYSVASWRGAQFTEIVMLNWESERDYLYQHIARPGLRCGPPGNLRACRVDEPAITQQAKVCVQPMRGEVQDLMRQAGCPLEFRDDDDD